MAYCQRSVSEIEHPKNTRLYHTLVAPQNGHHIQSPTIPSPAHPSRGRKAPTSTVPCRGSMRARQLGNLPRRCDLERRKSAARYQAARRGDRRPWRSSHGGQPSVSSRVHTGPQPGRVNGSAGDRSRRHGIRRTGRASVEAGSRWRSIGIGRTIHVLE